MLVFLLTVLTCGCLSQTTTLPVTKLDVIFISHLTPTKYMTNSRKKKKHKIFPKKKTQDDLTVSAAFKVIALHL